MTKQQIDHLVMKFLIEEKGFGVNSPLDKYGNTLLHLAVKKQKANLARTLLESGVDVNIMDAKSNTPLHLVSQYGGKECAELLLEFGASVNVVNDYGNTPLHLAEDWRQSSVARLVREHGGKTNGELNADNQGVAKAKQKRR